MRADLEMYIYIYVSVFTIMNRSMFSVDVCSYIFWAINIAQTSDANDNE